MWFTNARPNRMKPMDTTVCVAIRRCPELGGVVYANLRVFPGDAPEQRPLSALRSSSLAPTEIEDGGQSFGDGNSFINKLVDEEGSGLDASMLAESTHDAV